MITVQAFQKLMARLRKIDLEVGKLLDDAWTSNPKRKRHDDETCTEQQGKCQPAPNLQSSCHPVHERRQKNGEDSGRKKQHHDDTTDPCN